MTERELIEGCISNKQACQKQLFDMYSGRMMSVCLRYAHDKQQAKDILQEGFIKVFKNIHQFRFDGSFEGWLRKVFVTVALRYVKSNNISYDAVDITDNDSYSINPDVISKISADEIHDMIRNMPEGYRTIFNLNVVEGYTHEEISRMLDIKASTSRGQLVRARKYLQALIEEKAEPLKTK